MIDPETLDMIKSVHKSNKALIAADKALLDVVKNLNARITYLEATNPNALGGLHAQENTVPNNRSKQSRN